MHLAYRHFARFNDRTLVGHLMIALAVSICSSGVTIADDEQASASASGSLAEELVARGGIRRGVCAVVGMNPDLALNLARGSEMLVHARMQDASAASRLRSIADDAGFGIQRLAVDHGETSRLPYADNMVDVLITAPKSASPNMREILRALRPEGTALLKVSGQDPEQLTRQISQDTGGAVDTWTIDGQTWIALTKPPLKGAGDWSHWEHGPDNNPVSEDAVIKFPYMTQFMAKPYYIAMPSITTAAGGRTFLAIGHIAHHRREWDMMNKLIARNGYNGTVLWERKLPDGYLVHRSAFIATRDTFYMIDGERCLLLDPQTGAELGEIRLPGVSGAWKWMAHKEGVLYVLTGEQDPAAESMKGDRSFGGWSWADLSTGYYTTPHVPWGFGTTLAAYDLEQKQLLWKHSEEQPIDSRSMSMGEEKVTVYCPNQHFRCLNLKTGEVEWTTDERKVLDLIEEPGKGLTSTPGFRTACLTVFTPDALIIQGQTRQNVVALSTADGYLLWTKQKITNNPNAIFVDGNVVLGVGPGGNHVVVDPLSGEVIKDLGFRKRACTRLTASSDSFFVRGEGTLRYDRELEKIMVDGAVRPACNDGALPANGLLYLGPWQCDCNLSLVGRIAKCSAGDFRFDEIATGGDRLTRGTAGAGTGKLVSDANDWPTHRADNARSSSTSVTVLPGVAPRWRFSPKLASTPTPPVSAGGLVFVSGEDGKTRAIAADSGQQRWEFSTSAPIKASGTVAHGNVYFGSGDGCAYCVNAATGDLVWKFQAAPIERLINVYGTLNSTWPVNTGVLVRDGVVYFAAGIIDHDGTYVYALDAETGHIVWQNNSSGHLSEELRKGVSAQGNLAIHGNRLLLAGGNQVSPAPFDLTTGECLAAAFDQGQPKMNNGHFVGLLADQFPLVGGRILYSAPQNVSTKGSFTVSAKNRRYELNYGGIPPAWNESVVALVNFKYGKLTCFDAAKVVNRIEEGLPAPGPGQSRFNNNVAAALANDGALLWQSDLGGSEKFEAISLAICPNAVVAVVQLQQQFRAQPEWQVVAFKTTNGQQLWRQPLNGEPLPDGLLVDRDGQVIITMIDGSTICLGRRST